MKKQTNIQKVAELMGLHAETLIDNSATFIDISCDTHVVNICFDGDGKKFTNILIAENLYEKVGESVIVNITKKLKK